MYLSTYAPFPLTPTNVSKLKPVLVWLHGGGYTGGGDNEARLNGTSLASQHDIVVVVLNYRLGAFGFVYYPDHGVSGNAGMLDQQLGLEWVRQNIRAFGGDPKRVTIAGQSAGASSVSWHVVSRVSSPLYSRAAMFSGGFANWTVTPKSWAEKNAAHLLNATQCQSFACLQINISASALLAASQFGDWGPVIDGNNTLGYPLSQISTAEQQQHDLMMGSVRDDGSGFCGQPHDLNEDGLLAYLEGAFDLNATTARAAREIYISRSPGGKTCCSKAFWAAERAYSDNQFFCFARRAAALWRRGGARLYFWDYKPAAADFFTHAEDIPYWMNVESLLPSSSDALSVSRSVSGLFAAFIRGEENNLGSLWPTFPASLRILNGSNAVVHSGEREVQCAFWGVHDQNF